MKTALQTLPLPERESVLQNDVPENMLDSSPTELPLLGEPEYNCEKCRWRPPSENFCGTCIQRILDAVQAEKKTKENEPHD